MIILVVAAFFYLGAQLAARTHGPEALSRLERASASALLGASIWIAANWILSAPHWLNEPALLVSGAIAAVIGFLLRRPREERAPISRAWLILVPMACWIAFVMWRAYLLPIGSPDALIYHMPRAVLLWRAGGYAWMPNVPDYRLNGFASNYELLLADVLAVQHADTIAAWTSVLFFVLLLLVATALAYRWWGEGKYLFAVPYVIATIPIVILHAGAIKNDLMSHFFALSAVLWGGRWFSTRRFPDAALCIVALFAGLGTKNHLLLLIGIFGVIFFLRSLPINRASLPFFVRLTALAVIAFLLLGGVHYLVAVRHSGGDGVAPARYGEWHNLWQFPVEIFSAPFSSDSDKLVLPWTRVPIPWYRFDIYGSHYGQLVTIALLLVPLLLWRFRRQRGPAPVAERHVDLLAGAAFFLLLMPLQPEPDGFASYFARFVLTFPVLILCATVVPLLLEVERKQPAVYPLTIGAAVVLALTAITAYGSRDKWMPIGYVLNVAGRTNRRVYPPPIRAAMVVDHIAGPFDHIAVHGGHDTFLYPVYGASLSRDVRFITSPSAITNDTQWVIVDRVDNIFWHHPGFRTAADWYRYWGRGPASKEDLAVVTALRNDPRFETVYDSPQLNQSVFRRIQ